MLLPMCCGGVCAVCAVQCVLPVPVPGLCVLWPCPFLMPFLHDAYNAGMQQPRLFTHWILCVARSGCHACAAPVKAPHGHPPLCNAVCWHRPGSARGVVPPWVLRLYPHRTACLCVPLHIALCELVLLRLQRRQVRVERRCVLLPCPGLLSAARVICGSVCAALSAVVTGGSVAGIVIGSLVLVGIITSVSCICYRRRMRYISTRTVMVQSQPPMVGYPQQGYAPQPYPYPGFPAQPYNQPGGYPAGYPPMADPTHPAPYPPYDQPQASGYPQPQPQSAPYGYQPYPDPTHPAPYPPLQPQPPSGPGYVASPPPPSYDYIKPVTV